MDINDYIPIAEFAKQIGLTANAVRRKCMRGMLPGAIKMGRDWFVPKGAEYPDNRVKSGKYIGFRDKEKRKI